jgi:hypothetical protein
MLVAWLPLAAWAIDCPQRLTREDLDGQLTQAEAAYASFDVEGFRDRMNELNGLLLPCAGDLVPTATAARAHRLVALQQLELGNPAAAAASWVALAQTDPALPMPDDWLPADHPLRATPPRARKVPEPRVGTLAFDGVTGRERPVGRPTLVQRFDSAGVAQATAYLGESDPLPPYEAIPRVRRRLTASAIGAGALGVGAVGLSWLRYQGLLSAADDPTTPADELDRGRAAVNGLYGVGGAFVGVGVGLGVGAVVVGPR